MEKKIAKTFVCVVFRFLLFILCRILLSLRENFCVRFVFQLFFSSFLFSLSPALAIYRSFARSLIPLRSQSIVLLILCSLHGIFFHFVRVYLALCYIAFFCCCFSLLLLCFSFLLQCLSFFPAPPFRLCRSMFLLNGISMEDITICECISVC